MLMSEQLHDDPTARLPVLGRPDSTAGRTTQWVQNLGDTKTTLAGKRFCCFFTDVTLLQFFDLALKAQWSLYVPHSSHYMYSQFNIHKFYVLPTQLYLCVLCGSQNKQLLFPYTTLTGWFL